ncbi:hypothetical protein DHW03_01605 [Pedobacter yonginense]|uniref:Uncharacterized protein n=1 Tax=Pedobacter yonginense TaxID=651869 RepID=A0A317EQC9_9SPHI|nr:hypothetical protein [Pedobacter yonginense]PWS28575.1 hypothetical protein DHW03_01605 [Pedobacter yonginense]
MPRIFIFGIGGTGTRVLKSLTMLLASGVDMHDYDVVPIIIDPHKDLPELKECKNMLRLYSKIRRTIYSNHIPESPNAFFRTNMLSLSEALQGGMKEGFDFDERIDETFGEFLSYNSLAKEDRNKDLLDLLYNEQSLNTKLSVGFKGNPNIGSVVLNSFEDTEWYKSFEKIFDKGDRIFIISSIFGGTGASGLPLLIKNLRRSKNKEVKSAAIGALPIMPYFKLSEPDADSVHKDIDSNNFITKTKAALTYYQNHLKGVNALYYLADPHEQSVPYVNDEARQNNMAHIVELIGASAILDFQRREFQDQEENQYQYALKMGTKDVDFRNIGEELNDLIRTELTNYHTFNKIHPSIRAMEKAAVKDNEGFDRDFFRGSFIRDLEEFNVKYFQEWLKGLGENDRKFYPFNLSIDDDRLHNLVIGSEVPERGGMLGISKVTYDTSNFINQMESIRKQYNAIPAALKATKYMVLAENAIRSVNINKIKVN